MSAIATAAVLSLPISLCRPSKINTKKVVEVLNPLARDYKSIGTMRKELAELQEELSLAHNQVHISEARAATALDKQVHMEALVNDRLLQDSNTSDSDQCCCLLVLLCNRWIPLKLSCPRKLECLRSSSIISSPIEKHLIPIECFEEPWVIFCGKDGKPGCVQDTCAHRVCPHHLGSLNEGRVQCPNHGWKYTTDGKCEKMPSTRLLNLKIKSMPCFEKEGMVWIWPGDDAPTANLNSLLPLSGFEIHARLLWNFQLNTGYFWITF